MFLSNPPLDPQVRAMYDRDGYCSLAWGSALALQTSDEVAAAVLSGEAPAELTQREVALVSWCRAVVGDAAAITATDVDRLRAAGFGDRDIFEVTAVVAFRIAFSTVRLALGVRPDVQLAQSASSAVRDVVDFGRPVADEPSATVVG